MNILVQRRRQMLGVAFIAAFAGAAYYLAMLPFLTILGQLVIAILLGIVWRASFGVNDTLATGATFSSKKLLRIGIVLLGFRLDFSALVNAGAKGLIIACSCLAFAFVIILLLSRLAKIKRSLGVLLAAGTAICGASAIVAVAPQVKAKNEDTALAVALISIVGTLFTLLYAIFSPLNLSLNDYAVFAGGTLHEIGHVVAAASPEGNAALDLAIIVKLSRVALLVPVVIGIGLWYSRNVQKENKQKKGWKSLPIPWFIVGFLCTSVVQSIGFIPSVLIEFFIHLSYFLMAMAMAGLGLNVELRALGKKGLRPLLVTVIGSILLAAFGYGLVALW